MNRLRFKILLGLLWRCDLSLAEGKANIDRKCEVECLDILAHVLFSDDLNSFASN